MQLKTMQRRKKLSFSGWIFAVPLFKSVVLGKVFAAPAFIETAQYVEYWNRFHFCINYQGDNCSNYICTKRHTLIEKPLLGFRTWKVKEGKELFMVRLFQFSLYATAIFFSNCNCYRFEIAAQYKTSLFAFMPG